MSLATKCIMIFWVLLPHLAVGNSINFVPDVEGKRFDIIADIATSNIKTNGWNNILVFGNFPDSFFNKWKMFPFTFTSSNTKEADYYIEDAVPYHSNSIFMNCIDFKHFEESLIQLMNLPYWHPHANIYLYYHSKEIEEDRARIFFIFLYYRAYNVILMQYDDDEEIMFVSYYTPFISDVYEVGEIFGCWTVKKIGMPIYKFDESFICVKDCLNVTLHSKTRASNLGTCVGVVTYNISYHDSTNAIQALELFEDKGKNFHGYMFRSYVHEVLPFMRIIAYPNKTYHMTGRDGEIWNTMAKLLNFTIDLTPSEKTMKKKFDFENSIQQIFGTAHRKGDFFLMPIYQFDVIVVQIDYTFAYKESGACFISHRAEFETVFFDKKALTGNYDLSIKFVMSFLCIWMVFCLYSGTEARQINVDFFGKNLMNSIRSMLLISLCHPPKRTSFRIFLTITIWCFFIVSFATQAAFISFFTAFKTGREVNTFEDIIEKGYMIEGMSSPDIMLPETEERFRIINSKLAPIRDIFSCIQDLSNDSHKFCLVDCSMGHYLQKNKLNEKGEQYLHLAEDRVHSHYLNFIFQKHSVISDHFSKYIMALFEAGIIMKWEDYRFKDFKYEAPFKPLGVEDITGIFELNAMLFWITVIVFLSELFIGHYKKIKSSIKCIFRLR